MYNHVHLGNNPSKLPFSSKYKELTWYLQINLGNIILFSCNRLEVHGVPPCSSVYVPNTIDNRVFHLSQKTSEGVNGALGGGAKDLGISIAFPDNVQRSVLCTDFHET